MRSEPELSIWTIFDHPRDHPHGFIARRFAIGRGEAIATGDVMESPSLQGLRLALDFTAAIGPHLAKLPAETRLSILLAIPTEECIERINLGNMHVL